MNHITLANKYRPQKFIDVIGQKYTTQILEKAIYQKKIAHTFLLTGSRGTGKTTVARIIAKSLCCKIGITPNPCLNCQPCLTIKKGSSLDVIEIDGASNTGINEVRSIKKIIRHRPANFRFRIIIIDEVHMLSINAFNALLKTIEEPPQYVKFIFATTESYKIPLTILSRCQRYDFKRIPYQKIERYIQKILQQEKEFLSEKIIKLIAHIAEGSIRDALNLTDQILSFYDKNTTFKDIQKIIGIISRKKIFKVTHALITGNIEKAIQTLQNSFNNGFSLLKLINDIANEIRNLCLIKTCQNIHQFISLNDRDLFHLKKYAQTLDLKDLKRILGMIIKSSNQITNTNNLKITLELLFFKIADRPPISDVINISYAITKLEKIILQKTKRQADLNLNTLNKIKVTLNPSQGKQ